MNCASCKAELTPGERFCGECGQTVEPASISILVTEPERCPGCGAKQKASERFCGSCGQPMQTASLQSPTPVLAPTAVPKRGRWLIAAILGIVVLGGLGFWVYLRERESKPATSSSAIEVGEQVVTFDNLEPGPLAPGAFANKGIQFVNEKGVTGIYSSERNMVLPKGRNRVLLVAGDRMTSLTITFNPPIKRFSLTRIGTAGGASVPTWALYAYDSQSKVVASTGEKNGLPPNPREASVEGLGIVRVQLSTDNRFGDGTWATWNSLPVAEFKITR